MSELRQNPVNKHWVVIAKDRAKRPQDFISKRMTGTEMSQREERSRSTQTHATECPFDEGHEAVTPAEVLAYSNDPNRQANTPGWIVRAFPNKYPALEPSDDFSLQHKDIYSFGRATGSHEIIAFHDHNTHPALVPVSDLHLLLKANRERLMYYKTLKFVRYIQMFYNHGKTAGASLEHPHSQFFALPIVSSYVDQELTNEQEYIQKHGSCGHCAMVAAEIKQKTRIILQNKSFVSFAPFASRDPFETVIYPLWHTPRYEDATDDQLKDLAEVLKDALLRLYEKLNNPDFNYYIHTAPQNNGDYGYSHWHLKILPRLTTRGGFELATGIIINVVPPEDAAAFLRGE